MSDETSTTHVRVLAKEKSISSKSGELKVGHLITVVAPSGQPRRARLIEKANDQVKVHYEGFNEIHDEWLAQTSDRITAATQNSGSDWFASWFACCALRDGDEDTAGRLGMPDDLDVDGVIEGETLLTCGSDRWSHPTLVARPCMHQTHSQEESLQAVERCMDTVRRAFDQLPNKEDQILVLYDLGGAGYQNFDVTFTREFIQGLVQEFPDRLRSVLVINAHWSISTAWYTIKQFLHPHTEQKVIFCGSSYKATLLEYIDADHPYLAYLQK